MLGGVVEAPAGKRETPTHRADVDDLAPALPAHARQHQLCEAQQAEDVRLELAPGGLRGHGLERAALAVARIVDEHTHRPAVALDRIHRRAH